MSLQTHSKFFYGFTVSDENLNLDFDEGGSELTATLNIGDYTLTDYANEISRALNEAGAFTYSVSVNRTTRKITISAGSAFTLRIASGTHIGTTAFTTAGFTGANVTGSTSYTGNVEAGTEYTTQFMLQSYVGPEDFQDAIFGTVNQSASGAIEVVTFGQLRFIEMNLRFATDIDHGASTVIRTNATGVDDLRALMQFLTSKAPLEFMPDEDDPGTFFSILLESTTDDQKGLKYKLKEQYDKGLPDYFDTGVLKFRVIE